MKPSLQFYIDVSGQPKEAVFIGMICIQNHQITEVVKIIKKKFPWILNRRKKGSTLKENEIDSVISLLNGLGVRMACTKLSPKKWKELLEFCGKGKQNTYEKIFAALYFQTLEKQSKKEHVYPLTVCVETFMDISKVLGYLKQISSANEINYQMSTSQSRYNEMLKIADLVAAYGRKANNNMKKRYNYYDFSGAAIPSLKYYLKKLR